MNLVKDGRVEGFPDLTNEDFEYFKNIIFELAGISLTPAKRELVKSRLRPYLTSRGVGSYTDYRNYLSTLSEGDQEWQKFINFLTTNKTDFFREPQHFNFLETVFIPEWLKKNNGDLKIWCCASSSGEEPYSLSLLLSRVLKDFRSYKILATDIDTEVLQKAVNGVYPMTKLQEIPENERRKGVDIGKRDVAGWFRIADEIRNHVVFKHHNLIENTYPGDEVFDVIFCRNVLIYFSRETIGALMAKLHRSLKKDGLLFVSHSESISGCSDLFQMIKPSIYQKVAFDE